jgi:DnaJ-class molecular chaperone
MPGTSSHTRIRLTGKGMKKVNGYGHGDHYVVLKIQVPKHLSAKQKALVQAYAELETDTPGQILGVTMKTDGSKMFVSKDKQELLEALRLVLQGKNVDTATESDSQKTTRKVVDNRDVKVENVDVKNENEDHSDTEEAKRNKMP